jgi:tetratricopeptide (TPR) repeat protein
VGTPPAKRLERVRRSPIPARRLLEWDGTARGRSAALDLYASSWLLVHWFVHREPEAFARLQTRLAAGDAPADAWRAALPERDPGRAGALDALDRELAEYARGDFAPRVRTVDVPKAIGYFEQVVPSPEVHAIRLALWSRGPEKGLSALRAEVDEALEEDAAHPVALQYRAALDGVDPLRLARASVDAHGDDPRAWSFLAHSLVDPAAAAEREAAYRRAAELAPDNAAALHNLAQELLEQGRSGEALPVARQAAHLAPWSPTVLDGFASVLSDLGQCDAAVPVQQRAVDALPEALPARERRAFTDRLERYARQCRPTGAPASGTGSGT